MSMAVIVLPPLAAILLLLSTWTPPEMTAVAPLSMMPPPLSTTMPLGLIVPALLTAPPNVVAPTHKAGDCASIRMGKRPLVSQWPPDGKCQA